MITTPPIFSTSRFHCLALGLIVIITVLAYSNSFHSPLTFDDFPNIVDNRYIKIKNLSLTSLADTVQKSPMPLRKLAYVSFAINHAFHGLDVVGFHAVNLAIHIATGLTLYLLALTTLNLPIMTNSCRRPAEVALAAALLWLVHPVQTNAVTYIVQRMTSMAALFTLISLLCYIHARLLAKENNRRFIFFSGTLLAAILALLSKENSAMLPLLILGYELFFLQTPERRQHTKKIWLAIGLSATVFFLIAWIYLGSNPFNAMLAGYESRDFTLLERLLTEPRVIIHYLTLLLLPLPGRLNISYDFPISHSLFTPPQTILAILALAGLIAAIPLLYKRSRLISFALFWFLANLIIESSIVPLEIIFEHRIYLPSMFLFIAAALGLAHLTDRRPGLFRVATFCLIGLLAIGTWIRNNDWHTEISLWTDVTQKSPNLPRGYNNLGKAESSQGKIQSAIQNFQKAISLDPRIGYTYFNMGVAYDLINKQPEALAAFSTALGKKEVYFAKVHNSLGITYRKMGNFQKAMQEARIALQIDPDMLESLVTIGICYESMGQPTKAIAIFEQAAAKDLDSVDLYNSWAISLTTLGMFDQAISKLKHALTLMPRHFESNYNLGVVYSQKGMIAEAEQQIAHALSLKNTPE
ncbi:MAG: hypothetical protein A2511_01070 [Deltaproteobacteria bacterium RIFOXYD12_FULL_50_9]|nr:MAG: hypothetical protein A2511_01070 [Deltaproteobacteria bacterium RIFOXYD12_FULL_50_9]